LDRKLDRKFYSAEIDILRCLAAVSVSLFHYTWLNGAYTHPVWSWGWVGVEIFFVISGTVIAASLEGTTPERFVKARFLRLYPTAWICACISLAVIWSTGIAAYAALGINVYLGPGAVAGSVVLVWSKWLASAYWTLPIEIAFYLGFRAAGQNPCDHPACGEHALLPGARLCRSGALDHALA
jgi:exopolysaccharide production protein ExoZ